MSARGGLQRTVMPIFEIFFLLSSGHLQELGNKLAMHAAAANPRSDSLLLCNVPLQLVSPNLGSNLKAHDF